MICSKCGAENPDGIRFCTSCGAPAAQSEPQTTPIQTNENANANAMDPNIPVFNQGVPPFGPNVMQPMPAPAPKKPKKSISSIVGLISGFVSLIFSFTIRSMSVGSYAYSWSYGGDAYTGIQNSAAQTANNVSLVGNIVKTGFSGMFLVIGLALIAYYWNKLSDKETRI